MDPSSLSIVPVSHDPWDDVRPLTITPVAHDPFANPYMPANWKSIDIQNAVDMGITQPDPPGYYPIGNGVRALTSTERFSRTPAYDVSFADSPGGRDAPSMALPENLGADLGAFDMGHPKSVDAGDVGFTQPRMNPRYHSSTRSMVLHDPFMAPGPETTEGLPLRQGGTGISAARPIPLGGAPNALPQPLPASAGIGPPEGTSWESLGGAVPQAVTSLPTAVLELTRDSMRGIDPLQNVDKAVGTTTGLAIALALGGMGRAQPGTLGATGGRLGGLGDLAAEASGGVETPAGIDAYHGSPHSFSAFDSSKIGTGEGAQAYGHGLYFAENEGIARSYRDTLTQGDVTYQGKPVIDPATLGPRKADPGQEWSSMAVQRVADQMSIGKSPEEAIAYQLEKYRNATKFDKSEIARWKTEKSTYPGDPAHYDANINEYEKMVSQNEDLIKEFESINPNDFAKNKGHMYQVNIKADPEHFLDWDKPLSEQSAHVQDALKKVPWGSDYGKSSLPGGQIAPKTSEGAQQMQNAGIAGIRYRDAGSRGSTTSEPSHNYVVFNDKNIDIIKKYGLAGLIAGGPAAAAMMGQSRGPNR